MALLLSMQTGLRGTGRGCWETSLPWDFAHPCSKWIYLTEIVTAVHSHIATKVSYDSATASILGGLYHDNYTGRVKAEKSGSVQTQP